MSDHHRLLIRQIPQTHAYIEEMIEELDKEIQRKLQPYQKKSELACTVPGIGRDAAASILAEIGTDMSDDGPFSGCHQLASWAGICPGNNESGGKRKSGRTRKANRWLRATLAQTAWAGIAKKNSAFRDRYHRLKPRRGPQRAATAVAHGQLIAVYWVLRNRVPYQEQDQKLDDRRRDAMIHHHLSRLKNSDTPHETLNPTDTFSNNSEMVGAREFPSFAKEGWLRHKENGPVPYSAQTGWLFQATDYQNRSG